jgi:cation diffusion facilitator CzcD-associated flavoprotein CzcO
MAEVESGGRATERDVDVVVIGAGFAGLYALYKLREAGLRVRVFERGDGIGGTWYWNRYPGARVDIQSVEYMFTKFADLEQEWDWTELMPAQEEIERYLNWVADKLDLRRGITFNTSVERALYDEASASWRVETDNGEHLTASFIVAATGCLSAPIEPAIAGLHDFRGDSLYTNRFPQGGYDFTGKRTAVIGTGSSGVQAIPVIAKQAAELVVLQRSAAYTLPSPNRPLEPHELGELKAQYAEIRAAQWASPSGSSRFGAVAFAGGEMTPILEASWEEQLAKLDARGMAGCFAWSDVFFNIDANAAATRLYAEAIRRVVHDRQTAEDLVPHYPFGCKRVIIDDGYFATYNRENVRLINLRRNAIERIKPDGIQLQDGLVELDVIVYATGFDAMTGALSRIDVRGRDNVALRDVWAASPKAYLGLSVAGFPNLFTVTGPGSPSVLTNMVTSIEHHVEWITTCIQHLRSTNSRSIEADAGAQDEWAERINRFAGPIQVHPTCNSWYLGANVPGKTRQYMPYTGGLTRYMSKCEAVVAGGYEGFTIA